MSTVADIIRHIEIPQMVEARQCFDHKHIADPRAEIMEQYDRKCVGERIAPGMSIAVTAGSRGIRNIRTILGTVIEILKRAGAEPFIVPAMGSHGGATAEGQKNMLAGLGITEESMGCPVRSSMQVTEIGKTDSGRTVFLDRNAAEADGIVIVNRIKAHTSFTGKYESGLMKMMAVGLGKQKGAQACHCEGHGKMAEYVEEYGKAVLKHANIVFGAAILENAYDETRAVEILLPEEFAEREPKLLAEAKQHMPKLYLSDIDVLIVDRMGKDISGLGMDPHVTGAFVSKYARGPERPACLVVLDLTEKTHGNATGIGVADIATRRLAGKINFETTYANVMTAVMPRAARIPLVMEDQRTAIQAAIQASGCTDMDRLRMVRIKDTLHLEGIWVSPAMCSEVRMHPRMETRGRKIPLLFDEDGNLF